MIVFAVAARNLVDVERDCPCALHLPSGIVVRTVAPVIVSPRSIVFVLDRVDLSVSEQFVVSCRLLLACLR